MEFIVTMQSKQKNKLKFETPRGVGEFPLLHSDYKPTPNGVSHNLLFPNFVVNICLIYGIFVLKSSVMVENLIKTKPCYVYRLDDMVGNHRKS